MNRKFAIPVLFLACFLLAVYFTLPKYGDFKRIKKEVAVKKTELSEKESYLAKMREISAQLEKNREFIDNVNAALPDKASFASLVVFFQEKTAENGMILKSFNPADRPRENKNRKDNKKSSKSEIKDFYFSLGLRGTLPAFENILISIEKSSRMIEVENISIEQPHGQPGNLLDFYLLLKVYSY